MLEKTPRSETRKVESCHRTQMLTLNTRAGMDTLPPVGRPRPEDKLAMNEPKYPILPELLAKLNRAIKCRKYKPRVKLEEFLRAQ